MTTLAIDTSNELLAVALAKDGVLLGETMTYVKQGQTARLMPAIVSLMEQVEVEVEDLEKIIVAQGPGSYTGVRVGITTAKTMAWGLNIPIYPVSSLTALAYNAAYFDGFIMPFFNARRQAVFTSLYKSEKGELVEMIAEKYIPLTAWIEEVKAVMAASSTQSIIAVSPHIEQFKKTLQEAFSDRIWIPEDSSGHLLRPAHLLCAAKKASAEPVHLVNPNYLRITEAEANLMKRQKSE